MAAHEPFTCVCGKHTMPLDPEFEDSPSSAPRKRQCRRSGMDNDSFIDNSMVESSLVDGAASSQEHIEAPAATVISYGEKLGSDIVQIHAGPDKKLFTVHKNLLTACTPVFSRMFSGPFIESSTSSGSFPEDSPDAWELLIQYLYTGRLAPLILSSSSHRDRSELLALEKRIKLYCLAETYAITPLQDLAIDSIAQTFKVRTRTPDIGTFKYAYEHTSEQSPLRALLSRWFYHLLVTRDDSRPTRYTTPMMSTLALESPDLLDDVFALMRGTNSVVPKDVMDPSLVQPCTYHQHTFQGENVCPGATNEISWEASRLLKLMTETFPNSRKRWSVESLARRLGLDRKGTLGLVEELMGARKVAWTVGGNEMILECL